MVFMIIKKKSKISCNQFLDFLKSYFNNLNNNQLLEQNLLINIVVSTVRICENVLK